MAFELAGDDQLQLKGQFRSHLVELGMSDHDLAEYMRHNGYYGSPEQLTKHISDIIKGSATPSPELMVVVHTLVRDVRRLKARNPNIKWEEQSDGSHRAVIDDWTVRICPKNGNRWTIHCRRQAETADSWPALYRRWIDTLSEAKAKTPVRVVEAQNEFDDKH